VLLLGWAASMLLVILVAIPIDFIGRLYNALSTKI